MATKKDFEAWSKYIRNRGKGRHNGGKSMSLIAAEVGQIEWENMADLGVNTNYTEA